MAKSEGIPEPQGDNIFIVGSGNLCFSNSEGLKRYLSGRECPVPPKGQGRTSEHEENYCLRIYLLEMDKQERFHYPLEIVKPKPRHKSPDFILINGRGEKTGLEHTNATSEDLQHADAIAQQWPEGSLIELPYFTQNGGKLSREEIEKGIVPPGDKLSPRGWEGDEVESAWADLMKEAIINKSEKLNQGHYLPCDRYELLIYDNTPTMEVNLDTALRMLRNRVVECSEIRSFGRKFDRVSIVFERRLLFDVLNVQ